MSEIIEQTDTDEKILEELAEQDPASINPWLLTPEQSSALIANWPSLLAVAGIPDSIESLRLRWLQCYFAALADFTEEYFHFAISRADAEAYVTTRVIDKLENCCADNCGDFLDSWVFEQLVMPESEFRQQKVDEDAALARIQAAVCSRLSREAVQDAKEILKDHDGQI